MLSQLLRQRRVKWHPSLRSRRFDSARLSVNIGLAYAYSHTFPIDVTPPQAEYFANPKSQAHCNNAHRSKRFGDVLRYLQELIYRENSWLPHSFRTVLHAHEAHGVELIRNQFPTHRGVKQDMHQILEMGLTFRRKREFLQPLFNEKRFDLVEETLSPPWLYVILEPGLIARRRSSFFPEALARDSAAQHLFPH
jgi:hypothetical protein